MRRRLTILVAATTITVVVVFVVPLAILLRLLAEERAFTAAITQSQSALGILAGSGTNQPDTDAKTLLAGVVGPKAAGNTSVHFPDRVIGDQVDDPQVAVARRDLASFHGVFDGRAVVYVTSFTKSTDPKKQTQVAVVRTEIPPEVFHSGVAPAVGGVAGLGLVLILIAVFAADRQGRRISEPLRELATAANRMREGHLETRVPERGAPELAALGSALNRLAARVQQLLAAERDTVADLSHRLRTPVTALRLDTDMVSDPEVAERLRMHVSALQRTVDAIVHDARRTTRSGVSTSCDVSKVVSERVSFWSALAEEQGRSMRMAVPDRELRARIDSSDLSDVIDVLIDNVFAHTEEGVPLEVWVVPRANGAVVITVEDGGTGIPQQDDVIERGSSGAGSSGLGMDIARRAANASGGGLEIGQSRLGGALVRVVLGAADL